MPLYRNYLGKFSKLAKLPCYLGACRKYRSLVQNFVPGCYGDFRREILP